MDIVSVLKMKVNKMKVSVLKMKVNKMKANMKFFLVILLIISLQAFSRSETDSRKVIDQQIHKLKQKSNPSDYERALLLLYRDDTDLADARKKGLNPEYREPDYEVALKLLSQLKNDERALYLLSFLLNRSGVIYLSHNAKDEDYLSSNDSHRFLQKSASMDYVPAIHEMGLKYLYGHFLRSIKITITDGQRFIDTDRTNSYLVKPDDKKAFEYFKQATQAGSLRSQARLAFMYFEGRGVPQDIETARLLYLDAAQKGLYRAYSRLANDWYAEDGVTPNSKKFNEYYNIYKRNEDRDYNEEFRLNARREGSWLYEIFLNFEDFML